MTIVPPQKNNVMLGSAYMLAGCLSFSIMGGLIRELAALQVHPFVTAFWRTLIAIMIILPFLWKTGIIKGMKTERLGLHILRGSISSFSVMANFYAFSVIPLAEAVSYSFAAPLFATIGAVFILKEKIRLPRILAVLAGFGGMLVLLRPGQVPINSGVIAALLAAFTISVTIICVRILARTEKPHVITLYSLMFTLPVSFVGALPFWTWPNGHSMILLLVVGVFASITQLCLSKAISEAEASALMPLDFTRLVFSALIGYFFFAEQPALNTYIGAAIIMGSVIYAAHRERLTAKREKGRVPPATEVTVKPGGDSL
ncbi:DMT family transporter [Emcibacter sp.]|uniref:DMT family transporter n=1 Tax=Emcibacter sp. TaxID=1979954 RepID=UPI002AA86A87|nr:DMT family transporter [Emcibacter sp.]